MQIRRSFFFPYDFGGSLREIEVETSKVKEGLLGVGEVRCLKRSDLIEALANDLPEGTVRFGSLVLSVMTDPFDSSHVLQLSDGLTIKAKVLHHFSRNLNSSTTIVSYDICIGTHWLRRSELGGAELLGDEPN